MRALSASLLCLALISVDPAVPARADEKYIIKDAEKLNQLYNALGGPTWRNRNGWPVPTGYLATWPSSIDNVTMTSVMRTEGSTTIYEYYALWIIIQAQGAVGQIPALDFEKLEIFNVNSDTGVRGPFPSIVAPNLKQLGFSFNNLSGQIPNYSFPKLELLVITSTKATGSIPPMQLPELKTLNLSSNGFNGTLGEIVAPKLESYSVGYNPLTGVLPPLNYPLLQTLNISSTETLGGTLPAMNYPELTHCGLNNNAFTGTIPVLNCPKLTNASFTKNKLTGSIPTLNLPLCTSISFSQNQLDGILHPQSMPECREFTISGNKLTGALPMLAMPKCTSLYISTNKFTGGFNTLQMPALRYLYASENEFTGPLPSSWGSTVLKTITLNNNKIAGPIPAYALPELEILNLSKNKLTGSVPMLALPKLSQLNLQENKLTGAFPALACPSLKWIYLSDNDIEDLPALKTELPSLATLSVQRNRLHFDDIERNVGIASFNYSPQDSVDLLIERSPTKIVYRVKVGGSANTYWWTKNMSFVKQGPEDSLVVLTSDEAQYHCQISSAVIKDLQLYSKREDGGPIGVRNPWVIGRLSIKAEGGEWERSEDEPKISYSGSVSVNDLLWFEGSFEIDTEAVEVSANGTFSVKDIPLPGGGSGDFIISQGSYGLKLLGADGKVTDFANDILSKLPTFAGISLSLSELKLIGGLSATGIGMSGTIEIAGLSNGCQKNEPAPTTIEIKDVEITRTDGVSVGGMKVKDLGLSLFPTFCVKSLEAEFDREKNKLSFGATVATPFVEIGGGMALIGTAVDSIAWRIEATEAAVPIGSTNMGMAGFFGSISGIQTTPLDVELGGVFVTMVPKDVVKFDASGTYTAPATFGLKIDGGAIPTPGEDDQYQLKAKGALKYDFAEGMLKLEAEAHMGTTDGEEYMIDGSLKLDMLTKTLAMKGELEGGFEIQAFGAEDADEYPYDWINAKLGLPKKVSTEARFAFIKSRVLFGVAHLGSDMGDMQYVFDLKKRWDDPDFLYWKRVPAADEQAIEPGSPTTVRMARVPSDATRMVVRIKGATTLPSSSLLMPDGTSIVGSNPTYRVDLTSTPATRKSFWTVMQPAAGLWTISIPQATAEDVVEVFVDAAPTTFTCAASQIGRTVSMTWMPDGTSQDSVAFFVAGTNTLIDGTPLGAADLQAGSAQLLIPDELAVCEFRVEAQAIRDATLMYDTAQAVITVTPAHLIAPTNIIGRYRPDTKRLTLLWTQSPASDLDVRSYIIHARDPQGNERLVGEAYRWVAQVSLPYEQRAGDIILVRSVDVNGRTGCPTRVSSIVTDVERDLVESTTDAPVQVIPHPIQSLSRVRVQTTDHNSVSIGIYDVRGTLVSTLCNADLDAGTHDFPWPFEATLPGMYFVHAHIGHAIIRTTAMVIR